MSLLTGGLVTFEDSVAAYTLNQRSVRTNVLVSNIANSETPGYRSIGYEFEKQLDSLVRAGDKDALRVTDPRHQRSHFALSNGKIKPDVFVRPTESVPQDGNTVDLDQEMARLAENQLRYRGTVELLNRKFGILRYAINGGR